MGSEKAILWMDLETTGTDETEDCVIEVGAILTDFNFVTLSSYRAVHRPTPHAYQRLLENPVVLKMHTDNGLLREILVLGGPASDVEYFRARDEELMQWVRSVIPAGKVILAGSGVGHFDRRFIDTQLWVTAELLIHPPLDIGVVRRYLRYIGLLQDNPPPVNKKHRAFDDIAMHLEEARRYAFALRASSAALSPYVQIGELANDA